MIYFNRQGVNITIQDDVKAVRDIDRYEPLITAALNDLKNLNETTPGLEIKRYENAPFYEVKSNFGKEDIVIYPQYAGKKRREVVRESRPSLAPVPCFDIFTTNDIIGFYVCAAINWIGPTYFTLADENVGLRPKWDKRLEQEASLNMRRGDDADFEIIQVLPLERVDTQNVHNDRGTYDNDSIPFEWVPGGFPDDVHDCAGLVLNGPNLSCTYWEAGTGYQIQECIQDWKLPPDGQDGIGRGYDKWGFKHSGPTPNPSGMPGGACVWNYAMSIESLLFFWMKGVHGYYMNYLDADGVWKCVSGWAVWYPLEG
jgi:hypothetical protein